MATTQMRREIVRIPPFWNARSKRALQFISMGNDKQQRRLHAALSPVRGTSDHAATFFKYIMALRPDLPVDSTSPSVASVYDVHLRLQDFICLTVSQSGGSPELLALQKRSKQGGARTIALLNASNSLFGVEVQTLLPILAGPEKAVAATKSFVGSLIAF